MHARRFAALLLAFAFLLSSPAPAYAALTASQVEAVIGLIAAFGGDAATIANARAALMGSASAAPGSLWFGAAAQPTKTDIPRNTENVLFTAVTLVNNTSDAATIYTLAVRRDGTSSDSAVRAVELYAANGTVLASAEELDTKHQATLTPQNLTLAAGATVTITVGADIANNARSGKTLGFSVVAINASSPIEGVLPLSGTLQKID